MWRVIVSLRDSAEGIWRKTGNISDDFERLEAVADRTIAELSLLARQHGLQERPIGYGKIFELADPNYREPADEIEYAGGSTGVGRSLRDDCDDP